MGSAAKIALILAMGTLVLAAQLLEQELSARRAERVRAARSSPSRAALLEPLPEATLPQVPVAMPGSGAPLQPSGERSYVVEPGDTLARIAKKLFGSEVAWKAIYDRNRSAIPDPTRLQVGIRLRIPPRAGPVGPPAVDAARGLR